MCYFIVFLINQARVTTAKQEMDTLKTAVTAYQMLCVNPGGRKPKGRTCPADIVAHENILPEDADLKDPWGGDYVIETSPDGSGSISTSNAVSIGGLDSEVVISW